MSEDVRRCLRISEDVWGCSKMFGDVFGKRDVWCKNFALLIYASCEPCLPIYVNLTVHRFYYAFKLISCGRRSPFRIVLFAFHYIFSHFVWGSPCTELSRFCVYLGNEDESFTCPISMICKH